MPSARESFAEPLAAGSSRGGRPATALAAGYSRARGAFPLSFSGLPISW